jgi:hypothetical protein
MKIFLCQHKGKIAALVRKITNSEFDHITIKLDKTFHDFNFPYSYRQFENYHLKPWEKSKKVYFSQDKIFNVNDICKMRYSVLCNLNYVFAKLGISFRIPGDNCVTFVAKNLGVYNEETRVMSPKELEEYIKKKAV